MKRMMAIVCATAFAAAACSKESTKSDSASQAQPGQGAATAPAPAANPHAGQPAAEPDPHAAMRNPHGSVDPHAPLAGTAQAGDPSANPHAAGAAGGAEPTAADGTKAFTPFSLEVPKGWQESKPTSSMRAAEFKIPGVAGKDAELVIYYFGDSGAGGVDANLERWYGQFEQTDGSATKDKAVRKENKVDGFEVTTVKATGTYVANKSPANPEKYNEPSWAMLAAIVQTTAGPYYFKMVGPEKTVAKAEKPFASMIDSIKKK